MLKSWPRRERPVVCWPTNDAFQLLIFSASQLYSFSRNARIALPISVSTVFTEMPRVSPIAA
jgi:hypothetical protein